MDKENIRGLSGWLSVYIIWSLLILIMLCFFVVASISSIGGIREIGLSLAFIILLIALIVSLYLVFRKKQTAITFNVWLNIFWLVFGIVIFFVVLVNEPSTLGSSLWSIAGSAIWLLYWKRSKRVKNTFVN